MNKEGKYTTLDVTGMSCSNCALGIQKHFEQIGLKDFKIHFATQEACFYESKGWDSKRVIEEIQSLGYNVSKENITKKNYSLEKMFLVSLIFTIPLFLHMFLNKDHLLQNPIIQIILCIPVFLIGIIHFGKSALSSLKIGIPNMDVLIMIGTTSAFLYSLTGTIIYWGTIQLHDFLFFETTATIITLVLLGNVLEKRSVKETTTAIKELAEIQKIHANKELIDGKIKKIEFNEIKKGDILIVNSGDKIPTDGMIIHGEGLIDESMLTGESNPSYKRQSEIIIGGTILVDGNLKLRAAKEGKETVLSQIIAMVKKAQNEKPEIQKLGDKVSSFFVPLVLILSLLTLITNYFVFNINITESVLRSIAVLVISCPCAMGLATPTAVMVGLGRATKSGILIKGGNTLEKFASIRQIVFDKTGTLTTGEFKIKSINCNAENLEEVQDVIFSLESKSSHPIAKSIREELKEIAKDIQIDSIQELKGIGIQGVESGNQYLLGSYSTAKDMTKDSSHDLYLLKNNKLLATIDIIDNIKDTGKQCVQKLKEEGILSIMLSGDKKTKCEEVAKKLKIENIYSEQLPDSKLTTITQLNKEKNTAMVGDGINDAPALAKADVGLSLSNSTQIAIQSAEIILLKPNDLNKIVDAFKISKHTLLTIKQNLFWAFSYNIIAIPLAAIGLLNPMLGALFMAFSDIVVIGNSLRLKHKKLK